jgi:hypothetical protein
MITQNIGQTFAVFIGYLPKQNTLSMDGGVLAPNLFDIYISHPTSNPSAIILLGQTS